MDIALYIAELLHETDEVSVPGTGTFYKGKLPAHFDNVQKVFYPPGIGVKFTPDATTGAALITYIANNKHISEDSAAYFLEKFSDGIKAGLKENGKAELLPLGYLLLKDEQVSFQPDNSIGFEDDIFGLLPIPELDITAISELVVAPTLTTDRETTVVEEIKTIIENSNQPDNTNSIKVENELPVEGKTDSTTDDLSLESSSVIPSEATTSNLPIGEITDVRTETDVFEAPVKNITIPALNAESVEENDESKSYTWIKILAACIIFGAISYAAWMYYPQIFPVKEIVKDKPVRKIVPVAPIETFQDSVAKADSIISEMQKMGIDVEKPRDTIETVTAEKQVVDPMPATTTYEIIGASLSNMKEAENYIRVMRKKGIDAHIVRHIPKNLILVSIATLNDKESAQKELERIRKDISQNAWPYTFKHKLKP